MTVPERVAPPFHETIGTTEWARRILGRHAARLASGEVIFRGNLVEVHVFLHDGRIAWATTSEDPKGMLRHLMEEHGVDREALAAVVAECARSRKRFGETLVEWELATEEQVRAALRWQIQRSVASLAGRVGLQWIFLAQTTHYDHRLTFEMGDIWHDPMPEEGASEDSPHDRPFPGPSWSRRNAPSAKLGGAWRN